MQVSSHIVKLVLRNNALTTLRGIENLKSLEGLDLSNNIISNFLEIEILGGLSSLKNLWLQGNPLCCARWYRAQVLSFFPYPYKVSCPALRVCSILVFCFTILISNVKLDYLSISHFSMNLDFFPLFCLYVLVETR